MQPKVGDIVRILPPFYLQYAPLDYAVVENVPRYITGASWSPLNQFLVGFPMHKKKLWLTPEDVEIVGHVDGG